MSTFGSSISLEIAISTWPTNRKLIQNNPPKQKYRKWSKATQMLMCVCPDSLASSPPLLPSSTRWRSSPPWSTSTPSPSSTGTSSQRTCSSTPPAMSSSPTLGLPSSWWARRGPGPSVGRLSTCHLRSSPTSHTTSALTSGLLASLSSSSSPALLPSRTGRQCQARCTRTSSKASAPSPSLSSSRATPPR